MSEDFNKLPFSLGASCTLEKAKSKSKGLALIKGILSNKDVDSQQEEVFIKGMDISYLNSGYAQLNWWHQGRSNPAPVQKTPFSIPAEQTSQSVR